MNQSRRYHVLDAWRGIASLAIVIHHVFHVDALGLGVTVFFVISGYCLTAAFDSASEGGATFGQFMRRRVTRIVPPYMASVVLSLLTGFFFRARSEGIVSALRLFKDNLSLIAQNLMMLQWVSTTYKWLAHGVHLAVPWQNPRLNNPVYWSLNYEEQFYLILGCLLPFVGRFSSIWMLALLTAFSAVINILEPRLITGLFFDYWIQFAFGIFLFWRLFKIKDQRWRRYFDCGLVVLLVALLVTTYLRKEFPVDRGYFQSCLEASACAIFALLLVFMRPYDQVLRQSPFIRPLFWLGTISYSLYLTHPIVMIYGDLMTPWKTQFGEGVVRVGVTLLCIVVATGFYFAFERPSLRSLAQQRKTVSSSSSIRLKEAVYSEG